MTSQNSFTNSNHNNQDIQQEQIDYIESALIEADAAALADNHRLSHEEVFSKLREQIHY